MPVKVNFRVRDNSDEYSTTSFEIATINGGNYASHFLDIVDSMRNDMIAAIEGVIVGNLAGGSATTWQETLNDAQPANGFAQVESGFRVYGRDTNGKLHSFTIGTADFGSYATAGSDLVDLTQPAIATLVSNLEDWWKPEQLAVTVEKIMIVGRNS